jgi:hypothetical protein
VSEQPEPCPFCGGYDLETTPVPTDSRAVLCMDPECCARGPAARSDDEAWARWNAPRWRKA